MKQTKKMCTFSKPVEVKIEDKEYNLALDFGAAVDYQLQTGEDIMKAFDKLANTDLLVLCQLLAVMLRDKETNEVVGMELVKKIDMMNSLDYLTDKVLEVMGMSTIPADPKQKEKK